MNFRSNQFEPTFTDESESSQLLQEKVKMIIQNKIKQLHLRDIKLK
jgi:hypothetical protein